MNLPGIIGSNPTEALVVLYAFIQQHLLFEALAGLRGAATPIGFLSYLATVFSMIGLLVLIFSPKLWNLKYVGCWFALFIIVTLGGSVGPEFGYKFTHVPTFGMGSQPTYTDDKYACIPPRPCDASQLSYSDSLIKDVIESAGLSVFTYADQAERAIGNTKNSQNEKMIGVAADGSFTDMNFSGFFPQVVILYIANTLRDALQASINELVTSPDLKDLAGLAESMAFAEIPNEQVKLMTQAYNNLCGGQKVGGYSAAEIMTLPPSEQEKLKKELKAVKFTAGDVMMMSSSVDKNRNPQQIEPLIIFPEQAGTNGYISDVTEFMQDDKYADFRRAFVFNRSPDDNVTLDPTATTAAIQSGQPIFKDLSSIDAEYIRNKIYNESVYEAKYNGDQTQLKRDMNEFLKQDIAKEQVSFLLPSYDFSKSDLGGFLEKQQAQEDAKNGGGPTSLADCAGNYNDKMACTTQVAAIQDKASYKTNEQVLGKMTDIDTNFVPVSNCYDLLKQQSLALTAATRTNMEDLKNQLLYHTDKVMDGVQTTAGYSGQKYKRTTFTDVDVAKELLAKGNLPKELKSTISLVSVLDDAQLRCQIESTKGSNCDEINKEIARYIMFNKQNMIENSLAQHVESTINKDYQQGVAGLANTIGEKFTDAALGPVSWLAEVGASFKAGAYAAVLPIIKNIIIAFILVLTPILLLMGLIVPAWAPGVIVTVLVALLYIKFVDVTMVLMDGVLSLTRDIFDRLYNDGSGFTFTKPYLNFMDTIWAMAYMSSFLITAFLMFAAGNSKAVIGKLTGMDGTVRSTSEDVYKTGWKMTKNAIGLAAPTMGNTLVSSTALRDGLTSATAGIATFAATPNPLTTLSHQHQKKSIDNLKEADGIKSDTKGGYDPTTGETGVSKMQRAYNRDKHLKQYQSKLESNLTSTQADQLLTSEEVGKIDEFAKLSRKANLKSGATTGDTTFYSEEGTKETAYGIVSQLGGLGKNKELTTEQRGALVNTVMENLGQVHSFSKGDKFDEFDKKSGTWKDKKAENNNMKAYNFTKEGAESAISMLQKAGLSKENARKEFFGQVKYRRTDENGNTIYGASKVSDSEAAKMKEKANKGRKPTSRHAGISFTGNPNK